LLRTALGGNEGDALVASVGLSDGTSLGFKDGCALDMDDGLALGVALGCAENF